MRRKYLGGCHCGRIRFEAHADLEGERNGICNCSSCTMKGFIHHHVAQTDFNLLTGFDDLKLYKYGSLSAEHYFCKRCGVESFYRSRSDPDKWDINVRCLEDAETHEKVDIYRLAYQLGDGGNWTESQAERHRRAPQADAAVPRLWRLVAPADVVPGDVDVKAAFRETWAGS
jgi:hypothetical protein